MDHMQLHPNVRAVQAALDAAGARDAAGEPTRVRMLPDAVHTAPAAAAALGVQVGQIANSLVFVASERSSEASDAAGVVASERSSEASDAAGVAASERSSEAASGEPLLVLTSGAHRVDTDKVAATLGVGRVRRASAEFVREHTGQPIGGVAPLGHPRPVRTLLDQALSGYEEIWAAGGVPRAVFPTTYPQLLRITDATPTAVT
jgi:prolyl-tRNA editing enzyme YbaK/EbsC (Cys-tRNA(Pro) deacylase)